MSNSTVKDGIKSRRGANVSRIQGLQSKDRFIDLRDARRLVYEAKVLKISKYFERKDQADGAKVVMMSQYLYLKIKRRADKVLSACSKTTGSADLTQNQVPINGPQSCSWDIWAYAYIALSLLSGDAKNLEQMSTSSRRM